MSYGRYRYRSWRYIDREPTKYDVLARQFGPVVTDIKEMFLKLTSDPLDELLSDYGAIHGKNAEAYARKTHAKWKSGATKLSGKTMERLIELLPPYLPTEDRFKLLEKLLKHHNRKKERIQIRINIEAPADGIANAEKAISSLSHDGELANLPDHVMQAATWLYDDDITSLRAVIAQAEKKETVLLKSNARREFELFKKTILTGQIKSGAYTAELPTTQVEIIAYKPSKCFIATMCFGSLAPETTALRQFRDKKLLFSESGKRFVLWYYAHGDEISRRIGGSKFLLAVAKSVLRVFCKLL